MIFDFVPINRYSTKIRVLAGYKRINLDYPLLVRDEVAKKLACVADKLSKNLFLQIDSGYRTRKTQEIIFRKRQKQSTTKNLVYDPSKGTPPHTTGGAVDVSLVDLHGREINLSEPFDKFYREPQLKSAKISPKAQELRLLLNKTMTDAGFAPNPDEYWHFSYGDLTWAKYYHKPVKYQEIDLPSNLYYPITKRLYYRVQRIGWKVINRLFSIQTNY